MAATTQRYCFRCGAANPPYAASCFACGASRRTTVPLVAEEVANGNGRIVLHEVFKERYRILSQVGIGGFGAVFKAEDLQNDNQLVAIKEIRLHGLNSQEVIDATDGFNREVLILSQLKHPHIPRIYEHFTETTNWYLVMDFIEGETLETYRAKRKDGKLLIEQVLAIGIQLCTTLEYLHTRQPPIIYRDLKPANIMLTSKGLLYLIDFGVARQFQPGKTRDTIAFGSPGYAAPEQYGRAQTTPQTDLYGLGATLHNLLTGIDPEQTAFHFAPLNLPAEFATLEALIMQMLELDRERRPASASVVKQALQQMVTHKRTASSLLHRSHSSGNTPRVVVLGQPAPSLPSFSTFGVTQYIHRKHLKGVTAIAWSPDGRDIASASEDWTVQVWNALTGDHLFAYSNHSDAVNDVAWSPDGRRIVSASSDHAVHTWDATTQPLWLRGLALTMGFKFSIYEGHMSAVHTAAWSPDGGSIASGSADHTIRIWNSRTMETILCYRGHSDTVLAVAWSPDGKYIASTSIDHTVDIWNARTGEIIFTLRKDSSTVLALAWSPDGKYLAIGRSSHSVEIWDRSTKELAHVYRAHRGGIRALAWSPDGTCLASASKDKTVRVWDIMKDQQRYTYTRHSGEVCDVAWSPDGQHIASASKDQTVHVWQAS